MNRFLCSTLADGIVSSPGAFLMFEERGIRLKEFLTNNIFLECDQIEKIIFSKALLRAKIITTSSALTISTLLFGAFLANCSQHGIKLEQHVKAEHNPNRSNYRFWYYQ